MLGSSRVKSPWGVAGVAATVILAAVCARPAMAQQPSSEIVAGLKACLAVHKKRERLRCFETLAQETIARTETAGKSAESKRSSAVIHGRAALPAPADSASPAHGGSQAERSQAEQSRAKKTHPAEAAEESRARADYGLKRKKARKEPKKLAVVITAAWPDRRGRWHFETADGQVWRQKDDIRVRLTKLPVDARIEKGMFGGYFLDIKGVPSDIRVERLR